MSFLGVGWQMKANGNNKHSSDMENRKQIEEILLNDFGCFDDFTVDKLLGLFSVINWVACSEREPDQDDTYYTYPDKYHYTAQYNKYGKWAGKWTSDDENGYEHEVHVDYWKVIEPPCL